MKFIEKNIKVIVAVILLLLLFKTFQSCNRDMKIKRVEKYTLKLNDSLVSEIKSLKDTISVRDKSIELLKQYADFQKQKAEVIQSTVKNIRTNSTTTIKLETDKKDLKETK